MRKSSNAAGAKRVQYAALPYRLSGRSRTEVMLVTSRETQRWFGSRKYADSHRTILRRGESSCAGAEVVCDEFFANFGWACSHTVQTVVAHIKDLLSRKPPIVQC